MLRQILRVNYLTVWLIRSRVRFSAVAWFLQVAENWRGNAARVCGLRGDAAHLTPPASRLLHSKQAPAALWNQQAGNYSLWVLLHYPNYETFPLISTRRTEFEFSGKIQHNFQLRRAVVLLIRRPCLTLFFFLEQQTISTVKESIRKQPSHMQHCADAFNGGVTNHLTAVRANRLNAETSDLLLLSELISVNQHYCAKHVNPGILPSAGASG